MITKYGLDNFLVILITGLCLLIAGIIFFKGWVVTPFIIFGAALVIFSFIFFRDPHRQIPDVAKNDNSIVLAPADGKIIEIVKDHEPKYLKTDALRISIFLSPLDVHVNRSPVTGIVEFYNYFPGEYLVAYHPKSSEKNEQSLIGVSTKYGKVLFKQIVGILARRLVCEIKEGDTIQAGQKFGMMKFGSRMDIFLPLNSEISVNIGQRVIAGVSIIGKLPIF